VFYSSFFIIFTIRVIKLKFRVIIEKMKGFNKNLVCGVQHYNKDT